MANIIALQRLFSGRNNGGRGALNAAFSLPASRTWRAALRQTSDPHLAFFLCGAAHCHDVYRLSLFCRAYIFTVRRREEEQADLRIKWRGPAPATSAPLFLLSGTCFPAASRITRNGAQRSDGVSEVDDIEGRRRRRQLMTWKTAGVCCSDVGFRLCSLCAITIVVVMSTNNNNMTKCLLCHRRLANMCGGI